MNARGFGLLELLIAVAVLAVIVSVGMPAFSGLIGDYRARTAAEGMVNGLQLARTEAVRRNVGVQFELVGNGGWTVTQGGTTIQSRPAGEGGAVAVAAYGTTSSVTFNAFGMVTNPATALNRIEVMIGANAAYRIDVFAGGAARLCRPSITTAGDPRAC